MALVASPAQAARTPSQNLQESLRDFETILSDDQLQELHRNKNVPDSTAVLEFTASLDSRKRGRRGRSIASNLYSVLESARAFSSIVGTFVSAHPEVAALVWGSIRLTMLIVTNFVSYYEAVAKLFIDLGKLCPRYSEYQSLYPASTRVQSALCDFHASIVRFCKHLVQAIHRPWQQQVFNALWTSFENEFESDISNIHTRSREVKAELRLAKAQADHRDQQLQELERKEASEERSRVAKIFTKTDEKLDRLRSWQLASEKQRSIELRQRLLDSLSTHEYLTPLKQSRRKRHADTTSWLFQTPEFADWMNEDTSKVLWVSGKIGSGKTILTASVIDHILKKRDDPKTLISFYFPRFDDLESLKGNTALRSIVRQVLDPESISPTMEGMLIRLSQDFGLDDLQELLHIRVSQLTRLYIIVDGLDEFEKSERESLLKSFSQLISIQYSKIKLFFAGRESLSYDIRRWFPLIIHLSMRGSSLDTDIKSYVSHEVEERLESGDLVIGDLTLAEDIKTALLEGADGMFLWVTFQLNEICSQHCDEDIRAVIRNLPKSLMEIFTRVVHRIKARGHSEIALKALEWIIGAKRPLCLDELGEAILIQIGQPYSMPERLCNDIHRIAVWCENLVEVDEDSGSIQLAHHTVRAFLLETTPLGPDSGLPIVLETVDNYLGEICVTYLNFNDFKTTLARQQPQMPRFSPALATQLALGNVWKRKIPITVPKYLGLGGTGNKELHLPEFAESLSSFQRDENRAGELELQHPFLKYASKYWLMHTSGFREGKSQTWSLWRRMMIDGHELAEVPWLKEDKDPGPWSSAREAFCRWIDLHRHFALIALAFETERPHPVDKNQVIRSASLRGELELFDMLMGKGLSHDDVNRALLRAAEGGHLALVNKLLEAGGDPNAYNNRNFPTPLKMACERGHINVVERLVLAGAIGTQGVFETAVENGHVEIVEFLQEKYSYEVLDFYGECRPHTRSQSPFSN